MATVRSRRLAGAFAIVTVLALTGSGSIAADSAAKPKSADATSPDATAKRPAGKTPRARQDKTATGEGKTPPPDKKPPPASAAPAASPAPAATPAAIDARCASLAGLAQQYCLQCEGSPRGDAAMFFCKEKVRTVYCFKRAFKSDPECKNDFGSPNAQ